MLQKSRCRLCYFMMCILLIAGAYNTYVKADSIAGRAAAVENTRIQKQDGPETFEKISVVEQLSPVLRVVIGQLTNRGVSVRKDLRLPALLLWGLCVAYFVLRCWRTEEILCLHEKKYRAALIKYIHDIDGKKRVSCLT